jgi:hypothetical protein
MEMLLIFFKLILYPVTLLNLFMVSRSFWVEFFKSSRYKIMLSVNRGNLTISISICIPFISSSCLIALVRNSSTLVLFLTLGKMGSVFPH